MKPFGLFYDACLHLLAIGMLPKVCYETIRTKKYRKSFSFRLGKHFPIIQKQGKQLVWIHAVSLGETKAAALLVKRLKALPSAPLILLSTVTETGHAEGKKSAPEADWHVYLPFDFSYIIRPIVRRVKPDLVVLTETDFWFNFQDEAKKNGASIVLINGKISERSFKRLSMAPFFCSHLIRPIDRLCLQGELYYKRFEKLGIPPEQMTITGNLKLDAIPKTLSEEEKEALKAKLEIGEAPVLTLGSTHDPEERLWIDALKHVWAKHPDLKVFIVPRHPERFATVAQLLEEKGVDFGRWSQNSTFGHQRVILVDSMGVLLTCYQLSTLAFVGGSLTPKVGGHNILEPSFYGKPVLYGPWMYGQPDLLDLMRGYQGGVEIDTHEIVPTLEQLLSDPISCEMLGRNGRHLIESSRGALDSTCKVVLNLLEKAGSC